MIDIEKQNRISEIYKQSGLNKGDFAKKIGISSTFLSDILNNKKGAGLSVY